MSERFEETICKLREDVQAEFAAREERRNAAYKGLATEVRKIFDSFVCAGFQDSQALALTITTLEITLKPQEVK